MGEEITSAELTRMVHDSLAEMRSATLFIRTDKNRIIVISTKGGEIITMFSGPKHGAGVIPMLLEMHSATVRIDDVAISHRSSSLPPTPVLMDMLESGKVNVPVETSKGSKATPASRPDFEVAKAVLSELLTEYLGPLAPMCCDDILESLGNSLEGDRLRTAIEKMAAEAGGPEEAQAFSEKAWKQLGR
ncbi:MAG: hypothetical protein QNJ78_11220 [Gammaproteobacteria bacterium]|nr:hypothetical protein [Gammaproteobacteria bacterium]